MITLALMLSVLAGMLLAFVICRAIRARLIIEFLAGLGVLAALKAADRFGGGLLWPFLGGVVGYLSVVFYLRFAR